MAKWQSVNTATLASCLKLRLNVVSHYFGKFPGKGNGKPGIF
jgi:hypothetical protein